MTVMRLFLLLPRYIKPCVRHHTQSQDGFTDSDDSELEDYESENIKVPLVTISIQCPYPSENDIHESNWRGNGQTEISSEGYIKSFYFFFKLRFPSQLYCNQ